MNSKYSQEQLLEAFNKVCDKKNWKNPIKAIIESKDLDIVREAVIHFTGSIIDEIPMKSNKIRIYADGYYLTIGA